jgi:integrase/recombinase XerD
VRHTHCRAGIGRINALFVKKNSIDGPGNCQSRMLFDWMVVGGILEMNPAASVRGPKYVIKKGKTPVLTPEEARLLLDSIDVTELFGLRDRALLAMMVYSFARVSAVVGMNVEDYYQQGKRWVRLHEKGGKHHEVPAHHKTEQYLDAYLHAAGLADQKGTPLWRSMTKERGLGDARMGRQDVFRMIKRRCRQAELGAAANCHTFRATGITAYLLNGGTLEHAQAIAAHESPRTTKLYDRTTDEITLDEIERIGI